MNEFLYFDMFFLQWGKVKGAWKIKGFGHGKPAFELV
jgi:hypothetical protein